MHSSFSEVVDEAPPKSSSSSDNTIDEEEMLLNQGDIFFAEEFYDEAEHYYSKYLRKVRSSQIHSDTTLIIAYEKVGDAQIMIKKNHEAVQNYRRAITELRTIQIIVANENICHTKVSKLKEWLIRILINNGNALVRLAKEIKYQLKFYEYYKDAISCYEEAFRISQEASIYHSYSVHTTIDLIERLSMTREDVSFYFEANEEESTMAKNQHLEMNTFLRSILKLYRKSCSLTKIKMEKLYSVAEYLFLKHNAKLGNILLREENEDGTLKLFLEAFNFIGIEEEYIDEGKLNCLKEKNRQLIADISYIIGLIYQKKDMTKRGAIHFKRFTLLNSNIEKIANFELHFGTPNRMSGQRRIIQYPDKSKQDNLQLNAYEQYLSNSSFFYEKNQNFQMSLIYLKKLFDYFKENIESNELSLKVAFTCYRMGTIYFHLKQYEEALNYFFRALEIRKNIDNDENISISLQSIGKVHSVMGNRILAFKMYADSYNYSPPSLKLLALFEMGNALSSIGYLDEAANCYKLCLSSSFLSEIASLDFHIVTQCLQRLNPILINIGKHNQAILVCEEVEAVFKKYDIVSMAFIDLKLELGKVFDDLQRDELTLFNCVEVFDLIELNREKFSYKEIERVTFYVADVYEKYFHFDLAIDSLNRLLKIFDSTKIEQEIDYSLLYHKLACVQFRVGQLDEALKSHEKFILIMKKFRNMSDSRNDEVFSQTYFQLGEIYSWKNQKQESLYFYKESLQKSSISSAKAKAQYKIGIIMLHLQQRKRALEQFQQALSLLDGVSLAEHEEDMPKTILRYIGSIFVTLANYEDAVHHYKKAQNLSNVFSSKVNEKYSRCFAEFQYDPYSFVEALILLDPFRRKFVSGTYFISYRSVETVCKRVVQEYSNENEFDSCVKCLRACIDIAPLFLDSEFDYTLKVSKSLNAIGSILSKHFMYEDAIRLNKIALTILGLNINERLNSSYIHLSIARICEKKEDLQIALNHYREAMKNVDLSEKLCTLDKMGILLCKMQRIEHAKEVYRSALILCQGDLVEQRVNLLNNLGNISNSVGNFELALSYYLLALKAEKQINGNMKHIILNVGLIFSNMESYDNALRCFILFLSLWNKESSLSKDAFDSNLASVLNSLGNVLLRKCMYEESLSWFKYSYYIMENGVNNAAHKAGTLSNLGLAFSYLEMSEVALQCLNHAIMMVESTNDDEVNEVVLASYYDKYANISFKMKDYDHAMINFQKALELKRKQGCSKQLQVTTMQNIALIYCKKKEFTDALTRLTEVVEIIREMYGETHFKLAKALIDLGGVLLSMNELDKAEVQFNLAATIFESSFASVRDPNQIQLKRLQKKLQKLRSR